MADDQSRDPNKEKKAQGDKSDVSRRSFSFIAATVPAVFALSCKSRSPLDGSALRDAEDNANAQPAEDKFNNVTSMAFGEEGGKDGQASTRRLGEEGGATTRALGEEGGKNNNATTMAMGEEGAAGEQDEKWGPVMTTQALREEGDGEDDYDKMPTITTRALGEEGSDEQSPKHLVTSQALGEEGGKGGAYDEIRRPRRSDEESSGGFRRFGRVDNGMLNLAGNSYAELKPVDGFYTDGGKNNIVTTQAVGEEGAADDADVIMTSMALGEEASGDGYDDLYLTTRALHEEGSDENDTGRIKDVNATTMAVGEEGGDWQEPDFNYGRGTLPAQQEAMIAIQEIFNDLGQPVFIKQWKIESVGTARTNKQVLNISVAWASREGDINNAREKSGTVVVKWVQGWTRQMFSDFARIQIERKVKG